MNLLHRLEATRFDNNAQVESELHAISTIAQQLRAMCVYCTRGAATDYVAQKGAGNDDIAQKLEAMLCCTRNCRR
jgi:hypothetical protein